MYPYMVNKIATMEKKELYELSNLTLNKYFIQI